MYPAKQLKLAAFLGLSLLLTACAGDDIPIQFDSPSYSQGKSEGCWSANTAVPGFPETMHRDQVAFKNDRNYRAGWIDGFGGCEGNQQWDDRSPTIGSHETNDLW